MRFFLTDVLQMPQELPTPAPVVRPARRPPLPQSMVNTVCAVGEFYYRQQEYTRAFREFQDLVDAGIGRATRRTRRRILSLLSLSALRAFDEGDLQHPPVAIARTLLAAGEYSLARTYIRMAHARCMDSAHCPSHQNCLREMDRVFLDLNAREAAQQA